MGRFTKYYHKERIPEWRNYYINYEFLKSVFLKIKKFEKKLSTFIGAQLITNINKEELQFMQKIKNEFQENLCREIIKFNKFFQFVYTQSIVIQFFQLHLNIKLNNKQNLSINIKKKNRQKIKEATEKYYKEIVQLIKFVELNFQILKKFYNKYKQFLEVLNMSDNEFLNEIDYILANTFVYQNCHKLKKLKLVVQKFYLKQFFNDYQQQEGIDQLNQIIKNKIFKKKEAINIGFYLGIFLASLIITIFLLIELDFFTSKLNLFTKYQMPIFRGSLIIFLYWFFLGLNVSVWNTQNINYKRVFQIQLHSSSPYQIFKRVAFFLALWMVTFMYSATTFIYKGNQLIFFNKEIEIFLPCIIWIIFFIYLLWPTTNSFNGKGRIFFFKLLKDIIISPFTKQNFIVPWGTDQILSLVLPLRDLNYTFCYTYNALKTNRIQNKCFDSPYHQIELVIIFFPLVYRFLQCIRKAMSTLGTPRILQFINAGKYSSSIITTYLSLYSKNNNALFITWISFFFISTLYSYAWDLTQDFGFLKKNSKHFLLRNKLYYKNVWFYYIAIVVNLGLRFTWTLTISPTSLDQAVYQVLVVTSISVLETFRRTLWNYFRVELENLKYEKQYTIIEGFDLPFNTIIEKKNQRINKLVTRFVEEELIKNSRLKKKQKFILADNFNIDNADQIFNQFLDKQLINIDKNKYREFNKNWLQQDFINLNKFYFDRVKKIMNSIKKLQMKNTKVQLVENQNQNEYQTQIDKHSFNKQLNDQVLTPKNTVDLQKFKDNNHLNIILNLSNNSNEDNQLNIQSSKISNDLLQPFLNKNKKQFTLDNNTDILQQKNILTEQQIKKLSNSDQKYERLMPDGTKDIIINYVPKQKKSEIIFYNEDEINEKDHKYSKVIGSKKIMSRNSIKNYFN